MGAIPYKRTPLAPESQPWDGPAEVAKASDDDLRIMRAWYDDAKRTLVPDRLQLRGARVEVRGIGDAVGGARLEGYAALFDVPSETLNGESDALRDGGYGMEFTEIIRKGAFARAIASQQDVRCLWNHEAESVLGRTASGTLQLREDDTGLFFSCVLPDTSLGRDTAELIRRGDVNQCSFAFAAVRDEWQGNGVSGYIRQLLDVDLYDVGPVTYPAYRQTSVAVRALKTLPASLIARPARRSLSWARAKARVATL